LGGVVKEGQGWWMTRLLTSQWKALWRHILQVKYCRCSHLVRRQRNAVITHCVTIAAKILLVYPKLKNCDSWIYCWTSESRPCYDYDLLMKMHMGLIYIFTKLHLQIYIAYLQNCKQLV
jgi:hypothetical protein